MKDIRIAAVIFRSPAGRTWYNLERTASWTKEARKQGAGVVCFPEMNITGYGIQKNISDVAEAIPGPITKALSQMAKSENITILAGMAEKDDQGNIFASHLVIKPDGNTGTYRKVHVAPPERLVYTSGGSVPLFEAGNIMFGIQLCYDAHFPELSTRMALNGAEVIFMPHASPRGTPEEKHRSWRRHLPARAFDNSVFVIACNQTGDNESGLEFPGIAMVIGPSGKIICKDMSGQEGMLIADLNADDLARVRTHSMRYFLPNRRPELYTTETASTGDWK